jgi:hypothetical protein
MRFRPSRCLGLAAAVLTLLGLSPRVSYSRDMGVFRVAGPERCDAQDVIPDGGCTPHSGDICGLNGHNYPNMQYYR